MFDTCKYCGSKHIVRNGHQRGIQKWKCVDCHRSQGEVDHRKKFTPDEREKAIQVYLESAGFRAAARIMTLLTGKEFHYRTIMHWVEKYSKETEKETIPVDEKRSVLEMDELYTFVKKKKSLPYMDINRPK